AEDGIRDRTVTGVQTCALPISLVSPATATSRDVGRRLASDVALIEYLVSDSGSLAFVVARDTVTVVDLGVQRRTLARLVEFARGTLQQRGPGPTDSLWRGTWRHVAPDLVG